jgi:biotin carboxyl carrier protein
VGVFWRAPEPGAPPFVELGAYVEPATNLCIVEVMKLMNYVTTDVAGMIAAIHVGNGEPVAKGTPLFSIDAASSGA